MTHQITARFLNRTHYSTTLNGNTRWSVSTDQFHAMTAPDSHSGLAVQGCHPGVQYVFTFNRKGQITSIADAEDGGP